MLLQTPTQEVSQLEANLCYAFVDSTRILILYALNEHPHNVTELTLQLGAPQSKISRHLKVLRDLGLVRTTRRGVTITYELADLRLIEALDILRGILRDGINLKANLIAEL
ncbi:MAG: winged helix-turn-helix transcriptional regulator [Chloroflexi bacterium]|nr:winged helix-turn-helix transcriptional regulator [Chloroflexota bacterium]